MHNSQKREDYSLNKFFLPKFNSQTQGENHFSSTKFIQAFPAMHLTQFESESNRRNESYTSLTRKNQQIFTKKGLEIQPNLDKRFPAYHRQLLSTFLIKSDRLKYFFTACKKFSNSMKAHGFPFNLTLQQKYWMTTPEIFPKERE